MIHESSSFSNEELKELYAWPDGRSFRLNIILGPDGSLTGPDGTSLSLSSPEDRRILRANRFEADVIISGAASIRAEGWHLPPKGRLIVLSRSGDLPMTTCPDPSRVYIASSIEAALHNLNHSEEHILCEGGLETAELLHNRVAFDELAISFRGTTQTIPTFLDMDTYVLTETLVEPSENLRFTFWRRAVKS